jgi:ABC-2 type transport system permease protein
VLSEFLNLLKMQSKTTKNYIPAIIFFTVFMPLGLLLVFGLTAAQSFKGYAISGTVTFYVAVSIINSVAQSLAYERNAGRFSLMMASGIPRWVYAITIALSNGVPSLASITVILLLGEFFLRVRIESIPLLLLAIASSLFSASMLGMLMGLGIRSQQAVNQYSNILSLFLSFFAPVYFPLTFLPIPIRYLAFLEPTTYVSQAIYLSILGSPLSALWSLGSLGFGVILLFASKYLSLFRS